MEEKQTDFTCWLDKENSVVSFHKEDCWEEKTFLSREDMLDFCCTLISMGYRIQ